MSAKLLTLGKSIDKRLWPSENPLRQFPILTYETLNKLETKNAHVERLRDMSSDEIGMAIVLLSFPLFLYLSFVGHLISQHQS